MFHVHLQLAGVDVWWPGLILLGMIIGFLTGLFGVGGGFLLTPCLRILFNIPYPIAVGSDLTQIFATGSFSAWKHWKNQNVDPTMGVIMAVGALLGTEIGVRLLKRIGSGGTMVINGHSLNSMDLTMSVIFLALMGSVAFFIWRETSGAGAREEAASSIAQNLQCYRIPPVLAFPRSGINSLCLWVPFLISLVVGVLTGLLGVGGGFINFPLLIYVIGVPTAVAVGTSAFQILFATGYGAFRHALQDHVQILLVIFLLIGSMVGVQLGVRVSKRFDGLKIRRYFALVIMVAIVVIVWDMAGKVWL